MSTRDIPIGRMGRIVSGPEAGRVLEVVPDAWGTGGYFLFTYDAADRSAEDDTWVPDHAALLAAFAETGWVIDWTLLDRRVA
jgi:hypothetical protein